jgi:probable F420-dependent oxidoreductase
MRPFRFGVQGRGAPSAAEWAAFARRAEALGFDVLLLPDHFPYGMSVFPALAAAAAVTERLRIGSFVAANDFRHPALLAKDAATLDLLSGGRFELGLGAGWMRSEYEQSGIPFDPASVRIARLGEAARIVKRLLAGETVTEGGAHYTITDLAIAPKAVQRPRPPLMIAGGGERILSLAAREADIVGLAPSASRDGALLPDSITLNATERKLEWIRAAAGDRFGELELNVFVYAVELEDDRDAIAERLAADFELPAAEVRDSPHVLIGSPELIAEQLVTRRERFGISYIAVPEPLMEPLAQVIPLLASR